MMSLIVSPHVQCIRIEYKYIYMRSNCSDQPILVPPEQTADHFAHLTAYRRAGVPTAHPEGPK